ncbi:thylakoid membrane phosphoprotein 14 chloroplastic-like [Trifolium pratense]|uniref:Thylakoid membrane phosphoprotein 14 chloroplastic-like n=1 Tax=Trifolium pratense TaxID=57577 RepID=A0A2K3P8G6_TRIPR|nr:thylakoid membrane phosphoprotein 14 chloroplastic-like [Trifolium pratense]
MNHQHKHGQQTRHYHLHISTPVWDAVENKSTVLVYGGGALVAVWLSSILVGAINSVPLLPKIMELVGLGYTGWFVYRYLLFKSSRKELATDIDALKKKIAGTE